MAILAESQPAILRFSAGENNFNTAGAAICLTDKQNIISILRQFKIH